MAVNKQGRQLPTWYSEKVNMAYDVYQGDIDRPRVRLSIPTMPRGDRGQGLQATRKGYLGWGMRRPATPATPATGLDLDGVAE